ncbi:MAG: MBL fold metallo-hydrolase [Candidatus Dormibacteraceae bacterium]
MKTQTVDNQKLRVAATADSQMETNSYLVADEGSGDSVVIDANLEPQAMVELAAEWGCIPKAILLTHTDFDHIAGLPHLRAAWGEIPIAVHPAEAWVLATGRSLRKEAPLDRPSPQLEGTELLISGEIYRAGSLALEVLFTPGHSPGGVSLKLGQWIFTGDALFSRGIGRSDFANSDSDALRRGIVEQLLIQLDECVVFPGHGPSSTIGRERTSNPFLLQIL